MGINLLAMGWKKQVDDEGMEKTSQRRVVHFLCYQSPPAPLLELDRVTSFEALLVISAWKWTSAHRVSTGTSVSALDLRSLGRAVADFTGRGSRSVRCQPRGQWRRGLGEGSQSDWPVAPWAAQGRRSPPARARRQAGRAPRRRTAPHLPSGSMAARRSIAELEPRSSGRSGSRGVPQALPGIGNQVAFAIAQSSPRASNSAVPA